MTERQKSWLTLAALWLTLLLLATLRPLAVPDEGRYGEVGRWMLQSGDWLTPRLNGLPFFHKPAFLYWLEALSLAAFGVSAFALRLVPALHAGVMMVALYWAVRHISTEAIARRAAVMLGTSLTFLVGGQYINHDMLVATWISVAIGCLALAFMAGDKPHATLARLGFAACALGVLSKGLIGLALPGLVLLVWLIWSRQFKKIIYLPWLSGLAIFAAIALPWFVMVQQKHPGFFNYMFIGQQLNRYTAATYNNPAPWWFYLLAITLLFFPWVFFALGQLRRPAVNPSASAAASPVSSPASNSVSSPVASPLVAREWTLLCWVWVGAILAFFSIPTSKLVGYILPVVPPLAVLASLGWTRFMAHRARANAIFAALCALNIALALGLVTQVGKITASSRAQDVARVLACEARPTDTIYTANGFPFDLPFYAQTTRPLVVLEDWAALRQKTGDGWERELFEGADFDAQAAQVLQHPQQLVKAGAEKGHWLVTRTDNPVADQLPDWQRVYQGAGWVLYRSGARLAPESPKAAQDKGLPGCHQ